MRRCLGGRYDGGVADAETDSMDPLDDDSIILPEDIPGVRGALLRYRIIAWVVGVLLAVLVCIGLPLKYIWDNGIVVTWTGVPHGWLYMILLIAAYDLSRRVGWSLKWVLAIMAAGTVPFLSFVAEHFATKDVRARLAVAEAEAAAEEQSPIN